MSESRENLLRKLARLKLAFYILGGACIAAIFILGFTYYKDWDESALPPLIVFILMIVGCILLGHGKILEYARSKAQPVAFMRKMFLLSWTLIIFGFLASIFGMYSYISPLTAEGLDTREVPWWLIPPGFLLPIKGYFLVITYTSCAVYAICGIWLTRITIREESASIQKSMAGMNRMGKALSKKFSKRFRKKTIDTAGDEEQEN